MLSKNISASAKIDTGKGKVRGIFVSSGTPTIKVLDGTDSSGVILVNSFVAAPATHYEFDHEGLDYVTGIYIVVTNAGDMAVSYDHDAN